MTGLLFISCFVNIVLGGLKNDINNYQEDYATHDCGNVKLGITSYGMIGNPDAGFHYPQTSPDYLFCGSFVAGNGADYVVDRYYASEDWQEVSSIVMYEPGPFSDEYATATYSDSGYPTPKGFIIAQYSIAWSAPTAGDFVIMRFIMHNTGNESINNIYAAVFMDFDFSGGSSDQGSSDTTRNLTWMYYSTPYCGVAILEPRRDIPAANLALIDPAVYVYPYGDLPDNIKIKFMDGTIQNPSSNRPYDWSTCNSAGPFTIAPGDSAVAAFAIIGGDNLNDLKVNADTAYNRYWQVYGIKEISSGSPIKNSGLLVYPNPFREKLAIRYRDVTETEREISLKIYSATGRLIKKLNKLTIKPFNHIIWYGDDYLGRKVPAGVYFVRFKAGDYKKVEMVILLR